MLWHAIQGAGGLVGGGAIEYVGGTIVVGNGRAKTVSLTSLSGGLASSPSQGDLVLAFYGVGSPSADTPTMTISTSGYTTEVSTSSVGGRRSDLLVAYKFMGASPDSSVQFANTGSGKYVSVYCIQVWRGVDATSPIVTSASATGINGTLPDPPAITVAVSGAMGCAGGVYAHYRGIQTLSSSDLDGFQTAGDNNTTDASLGAGYNADVSGTYNPAQFTFSGTTNVAFSMCAATLALRPA